LNVNISLTGTAVSGLDYTNPTTFNVTYPAGTTNLNFTVTPVGNSLTNSKTIIASITTGTNYVVGTLSSATNILRPDYIPPTTTLFTDNFDTDTTANWVTNGINADNDATFNYDYSADGVPKAPHTVGTSTRGLRIRSHLGALAPALTLTTRLRIGYIEEVYFEQPGAMSRAVGGLPVPPRAIARAQHEETLPPTSWPF